MKIYKIKIFKIFMETKSENDEYEFDPERAIS